MEQVNSKTTRMILVIFRVFMLLLFFLTVAKSKTHGLSYPNGSYNDMTVKISMYNCIFGYSDIYGTISGNVLMKIGFFTNIVLIILGFIYVIKPNKKISVASIILSIVTAIGLSPIGVYAGIKEYNRTAASGYYYNHAIKISGAGMFLFLFIVILIIEIVGHYYFIKEEKK